MLFYSHAKPIGGTIWHKSPWPDCPWGLVACSNFDKECRHIAEPIGFYRFAWKPTRCRNGKLRWLRLIEDHLDGTFSLGNRAY